MILPSTVKSYLRRVNPTRVAILGFAVTLVLLLLLGTNLIGISTVSTLGPVLPAGALALQLYRTALSLQEDSTAKDNERFRELVSMIEELEGDLTDYRRVTRVLENRNVELDAVLEQTNASRGIWIAFGDQTLNTVPDGISAEDIDDDNWVRYILERDYDLVMVTPQSWLIPPAIVEQEGLKTANQGQLKGWLDENVFGKFPDSTATIPLMSVVDLGRSHVRQGTTDAHMDTIPISIIENADTFTEEDLLEALRVQQLNLLDVVKSGTLVFFLPLDLTETQIDAIRANEETATQYFNDDSLQGLADEENTADLTDGLAEIEEVERPDELAEDIIEEAQRWKRVLAQ